MDDRTQALALAERIAAAEPFDTEGLDAIDAEVSAYLSAPLRPYTRSRDALKAARPPAWHSLISSDANGSDAHMIRRPAGTEKRMIRMTAGQTLPTEELAELRALILAVAMDRADQEAIDSGREVAHWPLKVPGITQ